MTDRSAAERTVAGRTVTGGTVTDLRVIADADRDGIDDRVEAGRGPGQPLTPEDVLPPDTQVRVRARTSVAAVLALIAGLSGLYAALSGRLAMVGLVLSVVGVLLAFVGIHANRPAVADRRAIARAARGRTVTGHAVAGGGLASFALLVSLAGFAVAMLALNHTASWLDSSVDQVSNARSWLDTQLPWLRTW